MNSYVVAVAEGLADRVDGVNSAVSRVKRVYAVVRRAARVSGNSLVDDILRDTSVRADLNRESACGMHHKRDVDTVEISAVQKFALAAEVLDDTLFAKLASVSYLKQLLCGNYREAYSARELRDHALILQRRRNSEHSRALRVVSAGVYRARGLVCRRVRGADDRVKLGKHHYLRSFPAGVYHGIKSGYSVRKCQLVAKLAEFLFHIRRGLELLVARLGIIPDIFLGFKYEISVFFYDTVNVFHFLFS